jgi:hypothetical protein
MRVLKERESESLVGVTSTYVYTKGPVLLLLVEMLYSGTACIPWEMMVNKAVRSDLVQLNNA